MYSIEIWRGGKKLAEARGENEAALLYRGAYEAGDEIRFSSDSQHAVVQVDQQVKPARVYLPSGASSIGRRWRATGWRSIRRWHLRATCT